MSVFLVAIGGAFGSIMRYWIGSTVNRTTRLFPAGTFAVNVIGSLLVGMLTGLMMNAQTHPNVRPALIVGFCGGFTTFSTFSMETVGLVMGGQPIMGLFYAIGSVIACVAGAALGFMIGRPASA